MLLRLDSLIFTEGNYSILLVKQLTSLQDETTGMPENPTDVP